MSGRSSQRKGADGERELAAILREYGYNVRRDALPVPPPVTLTVACDHEIDRLADAVWAREGTVNTPKWSGDDVPRK